MNEISLWTELSIREKAATAFAAFLYRLSEAEKCNYPYSLCLCKNASFLYMTKKYIQYSFKVMQSSLGFVVFYASGDQF